jgi:hypothetical protein
MNQRWRTVRWLGSTGPMTGATKTELLDSASEIVRDRASSFVLGLAGIQPAATPSVSVNLEIKAGYVIDLSDAPRRPCGQFPTSENISPAEPLRSQIRLEWSQFVD